MYRLCMTKRLILLTLIVFSPIVNSDTPHTKFTPIEHIIANLLVVSGSADKVKIGAKLLYTYEDPKTEILDIAALKLSLLGSTYPDTSAWLIKAIGQAPQYRYLDTLLDLKSEIKSKKPNRKTKKILKYLNVEIKKLKALPLQESFDTSTLNIDTVYNLVVSTNNNGPFHYDDNNSVRYNDTVDTVYEKLGSPSSISTWGRIISFPIHHYMEKQEIIINNLQLVYNGLMIIDFKSLDGQHVVKKISRILPEEIEDAQEPWTPYVPDMSFLDDLNRELIPADSTESLTLARKLIHHKRYNIEHLDTAANKIWKERTSEDREMINAIAHLVRYIGESKNPRYTSFLKNTLEETKKRKLRKHLKRAIRTLPSNTEDIDQYSPYESEPTQ